MRLTIRGLAHAAVPPLLNMSEPSGSTGLADARFHKDLLGLKVLYLGSSSFDVELTDLNQFG